MLLNAVTRAVTLKMDDNKTSSDEMSASQIQNVKLQLDQIVPTLCGLFEMKYPTEPNLATDADIVDQIDQIINTYTAILITLSTISGKEDWVEMVYKQVGFYAIFYKLT